MADIEFFVVAHYDGRGWEADPCYTWEDVQEAYADMIQGSDEIYVCTARNVKLILEQVK